MARKLSPGVVHGVSTHMFQTSSISSSQFELDLLARQSVDLGHNIVLIHASVDMLDKVMSEQVTLVDDAQQAARRISQANTAVRNAAENVGSTVRDTVETVGNSATSIRATLDKNQTVAEWVQTLDASMAAITRTLGEMSTRANAIKDIAQQVNMLSINARIEAARSGDAGRGFAVVAQEIDRLSHQTAETTQGITLSIEDLTGSILALQKDSGVIAREASQSLKDSTAIEDALGRIIEKATQSEASVTEIMTKAADVDAANSSFMPVFANVKKGISETAAHLHDTRAQLDIVVDISESMVQKTVELGGASDDAQMIETVQSTANDMSAALEQAVARGDITMAQLMDFTYHPIPDTNPQQHLAAFTDLTDRLFPAFQEAVLQANPKVTFCAAVDRNGYLPTHNRKFSSRQTRDVDWNAANARNRRIFNDRVGLAAGQNTKPFLLQIYRRDMGGGHYKMMKDISAPIMVNGAHWGGLRLAYEYQGEGH